MVLSQNMKIARKAAGLSQSELGEKIGRGMRSIIHYEKGERPAPADVIKRWAKITGVTVAQLYSEDSLKLNLSEMQDKTRGTTMEVGMINTLLDRIEVLSAQVRNQTRGDTTINREVQNILHETVRQHGKLWIKLAIENATLYRTIVSVNGFRNFEQYLGYTKEEMMKFLNIGNEYTVDTHPLSNLLTNTSSAKIVTLWNKLLPTFNLVQDGYSPSFHLAIPVTCKHKEGKKVYAMLSNVLFFNEMEVECKITFLQINN